MFEHQLAKIGIAAVLIGWSSVALTEDFLGYRDESVLVKVVQAIPVSNTSLNAAGYARLLELDPDNEFYWTKFKRYSGRDDAEQLKAVKSIPASDRVANAEGYARLLERDPNNPFYRSKFEWYSGPKKSPKAVNLVSELGVFLAGSWCVLDNEPSFGSDSVVEKLIVLEDGSYALFSKRASASAWDGTKRKGKFTFDSSRYPDTGERYFSAKAQEYGSPKLQIDGTTLAVSWHHGERIIGDTTRDSCNRFES